MSRKTRRVKTETGLECDGSMNVEPDFLKIKIEPGLGDNEEELLIRKSDYLYSLREQKEYITPERPNPLEEQTISGAIGRYNHYEQLRKTFGNDTVLSNSADTNVSRFMLMSDDSNCEETWVKGSPTINSDEELAKRKRMQKHIKEKRSDKKKRKRRPIPSDTWLTKVSDSLSAPEELTDRDVIRKPPTKHHIGFIGGVDRDELSIDGEGNVHIKASGEAMRDIQEKKCRKDSELQEEDLSLIMQECYLKRVAPMPDEQETVVDTMSMKIGQPNSAAEITALKMQSRMEVETAHIDAASKDKPKKVRERAEKKIKDMRSETVKQVDDIRSNGISIPETHDLFSKLSHMLIGERTERECILLTEMHLQQMTSIGEEFTDILEMLMREKQYNLPFHSLGPVDKYLARLRQHTRVLEESFLRQPLGGERECVEGDQCEGRMVPYTEMPITLVEYQPMEEVMHYRRTGEWRGNRKHCIMCLRKITCFAYFYIKSQCVAYDQNMLHKNECISEKVMKPLVIAPFSNIVGEGEYSPWDVMVSTTTRFLGLLEPVVIHVRWRYKQVKRDGIIFYEQTYERPDRNLQCRDTLDCDDDLMNEISREMIATSSEKTFQPPGRAIPPN